MICWYARHTRISLKLFSFESGLVLWWKNMACARCFGKYEMLAFIFNDFFPIYLWVWTKQPEIWKKEKNKSEQTQPQQWKKSTNNTASNKIKNKKRNVSTIFKYWVFLPLSLTVRIYRNRNKWHKKEKCNEKEEKNKWNEDQTHSGFVAAATAD